MWLVLGTHPVSTDSDVEDEVERRRGEGVPHVLVVDACAGHLHELHAVSVPGDGLVEPRAGRAVDDHAPGVPAVVRDPDVAADAIEFVTDAARRHVAVYSSVSR